MPAVKPEFAPGCFGSALTYKATDMICRACPFAGDCAPAHEVAKAEMRARFGITVKSKPSADPKPEPSASGDVIESPEMVIDRKTQELLDRIDRSGMSIAGSLRDGINPFEKTMRFMKVACHLLLRLPNVSQDMITAGCMHAIGCQRNTAETYARLAVRVLTHVGAVEVNDGLLSIRRN